jgi:2-oxo-4-hydroxy-4-carboxy--5-ureidoimidazoline (OHCU) decarboxylase
MKAGWYENKLKARWRSYQNENTTNEMNALKNKSLLSELIEINEGQWKILEATNDILRFEDIPWLNSNAMMVLHIKKETKKKLLLRWHPDRFFSSKIWSRIHKDDTEKVKQRVNDICRIITSF